MNYQILTRKWRPQLFEEVVGQQYIIKAICNSLSLKRIHQAWVLSGTRGIGKTTLSRLIAKGLNCQTSITKNPCRLCSNCKDIENGCFIDLIEVDAASRTKIEDIKEILENVQYGPTQGRFKIYLIDEVHMLSRYSFNALLKILEEPPNHVKFILATTQKEKIPNTIISRCLVFNLQSVNTTEIYSHLKKILKKESIVFEEKAIELIADKSEGSLRDALNLTEQAISIGNGKITKHATINILGIIDEEEVFYLTKALFKKNIHYVFNFLYNKESSRINWDNLLIDILRLVHHFAILKKFSINIEDNHYMYNFHEKIKSIIMNIDMSLIYSYYKILLIGRKDISLAPTLKIGCEITLLRILNF